jgi:two-component system sporulation sensor kinase A
MSKSFPFFKIGRKSIFYDPDELIDLFLNCTADGFAIVDLKNRFLMVNHMYSQIFGYTEDELIGKKVDEISNPEMLALLEEVKKGKAFTNVISKRRHKDGTKMDVAVSYSPFRNSDGDIMALIGIFRDMTDFVEIERELKETRELYKLITENTTDFIKVINKDRTIVYA